jgi:hypothetical protein
MRLDVWPNDGRNKFDSYKTSFGGTYLIPVIRSSLAAKEPNPFMHSNSSEKKCPGKNDEKQKPTRQGIFVKLDAPRWVDLALSSYLIFFLNHFDY